MDSEFWISELTDDDLPAVITLCRSALDAAVGARVERVFFLYRKQL
ncbi:hypothetical protein [Paractinoplanes durhamensis]|uniref:GNAT family N-acetyltransferase n=1 Tax=Paractinoplanes durhamensis TaxID=113563 RepID=A0ABQ3YQ85_9ACTN|nr:hypothetical protein [Actinoplanes durhamensis]GID99752.1 hypothetical protein Adu01nite_11030 [Actinoplanes durhamensis]